MPAYDPLTPRQQEFVDKLAQLLGDFADVCGPVRGEEDDDGSLMSAQELAQRTPVPHPVLNQWMLLTSWTDLDDGDIYTSAFVLPGMPTYHRVGMLMTWMEAWK